MRAWIRFSPTIPTGFSTWRDSYRPLMQTWSDAMDDGVRTPKVSFMLPFGANEDTRAQLKDLYLDIYRKDVNRAVVLLGR